MSARKRPPQGRIVMIRCSGSRHRSLLAGTIGTLALAIWPAAAQQTPVAPEAPPPWAQGRPETAIGANLAPIVPPPLPTTADKLPIAKLKAPKGFKIEVYASGKATPGGRVRLDSEHFISTLRTGRSLCGTLSVR